MDVLKINDDDDDRQFHSTETTLFKIVHGLAITSDSSQVFLSSLLDLSAAFDTVDHAIPFFKRLENTLGFALKGFSSYLMDRTQQVVIDAKFVSEIVFFILF